jgi:hypothetical protein
MGIRVYYGPESRVLPATEAEIPQEAVMFNSLENSQESEGNDDGVDTVRVADNVHDFDSEPKKSQEEFTPSTSASLPSPLLCPRRTFLASVILASKAQSFLIMLGINFRTFLLGKLAVDPL